MVHLTCWYLHGQLKTPRVTLWLRRQVVENTERTIRDERELREHLGVAKPAARDIPVTTSSQGLCLPLAGGDVKEADSCLSLVVRGCVPCVWPVPALWVFTTVTYHKVLRCHTGTLSDR